MADRILVVDDEVDILNLTKMILSKAGYSVSFASDGEEALKKAEAEIPDLMLLDVVMPGKSGLEVCKRLKSNPQTKQILIVMFTALGRDVDRKLTAEVGCDGHFTKPYSHEALLKEVQTQLEKARAEKFSSQLRSSHDQIKGKKILLEYDPAAHYERLVRDFVLECQHHGEAAVILTRTQSAIRQVLEGDKDIEIIDLSAQTMLSPILQSHPEGLGLVYDSLTDLTLTNDSRTAYGFAKNATELLCEKRVTALFLLNSSAHEQKEISSLRALFSSIIIYSREGITIDRL